MVRRRNNPLPIIDRHIQLHRYHGDMVEKSHRVDSGRSPESKDVRTDMRHRDAQIGAEAEAIERRARQRQEAALRDAGERYAHVMNQEHLAARVHDAETRLQQVYASTSWRIGNAVVRVLTLGRRSAAPQ